MATVLPSSFLVKEPKLTWPDIRWGYERGLIGWQTPIEVAEARVSAGSSLPGEIELASCGKETAHRVGDLLATLAAQESKTSDVDSKRKWLRLLLKWGWEHRSDLADPLGYVEEVYADFDYPPEISHFVRYMPPSDGYAPEKHSEAQNRERIMKLWAGYLQEKSSINS